jgi:hypothetical protein
MVLRESGGTAGSIPVHFRFLLATNGPFSDLLPTGGPSGIHSQPICDRVAHVLPIVRRGLIEGRDCCASGARREMRVPHRHRDRRVSHELLDRFDRDPAHRQVRGVRVTQRMPADLP